MRIALVAPFYYPSTRGNAITVDRIASGLRERGHLVRIYSLESFQNWRDIPAAIRALGPHVVHGFHAFMTGDLVVAAAAEAGVPALVTITGTDVNHDLFHPERRARVVEALKRAQGVVVFHRSIEEKVLSQVPELYGRVRVIRQTVRCDAKADDHRAQWGLTSRHIIFLFAAGIRQVKNLPLCIPALSRLHTRYPDVRAFFAGPIVEEKEGERLFEVLAGHAWARYLGEVPHEVICSMLRVVDVVVNSSLSEGGMSNAVLEAMCRGVAVLASDIEGNRSVIVNELDGLLFSSEDDFERKAERLIRDPEFRQRLGRQAKAKIEREFSGEQETDAYEQFYYDLRGAAAGTDE